MSKNKTEGWGQYRILTPSLVQNLHFHCNFFGGDRLIRQNWSKPGRLLISPFMYDSLLINKSNASINPKSYNSSNFLIDEFERKIQISLTRRRSSSSFLLCPRQITELLEERPNNRAQAIILCALNKFGNKSCKYYLPCDKNFIAFRSSCGGKQFTHK